MTSQPTLRPVALILIVLGTALLAASNVWILQYAPAEIRIYELHYFIASPLVLGLLLLLILPRLVQQQTEEEPSLEKDVTPEPPPPPEPSPAAAIQLLALLQREGRLVDFLQEEIEPYNDTQIGAAVRAIHQGCRKALAEHFTLEPVISGQEGSNVTVPEGFDPSAVRLTGNVLGQPPFKGVLRHPGWRTAKVDLPAQLPDQDLALVTPAEVEIP